MALGPDSNVLEFLMGFMTIYDMDLRLMIFPFMGY